MLHELYETITTGPPVTAAVTVACCVLFFGVLVYFAVVVIEYVQREVQIRKLIRAMKSGWLSCLMLLILAGIAHAGPEADPESIFAGSWQMGATAISNDRSIIEHAKSQIEQDEKDIKIVKVKKLLLDQKRLKDELVHIEQELLSIEFGYTLTGKSETRP